MSVERMGTHLEHHGVHYATWRVIEDCINQLICERTPSDFHCAVAHANAIPLRPDGESVNRHVSEGYEVFVIQRGRARLLTPHGTLSLYPGCLVIVDPGVEHEELPAVPEESYELACFNIDRTLVQLFYIRYASAQEPLVEVQVDLIGSEEMESIGMAAATELAHRKPGWDRALGYLLRYLAHVLRRRLDTGSFTYHIGSDVRNPAAWPRREAAILFCSANLSYSLRLPDIARRFGYSPRHLSRLFARQVGKPFSKHVRELRMKVAAELLATSKLSIAEIANNVGYADQAHFTRAFRAITNLSPRDYRRLHTVS